MNDADRRRRLVADLAAHRARGDDEAARRTLAALERLDRAGAATTPEAGR
ncbi:MAG: hypothetical protein AB7U25_26240 [Vicinamibacterales bacterium]